MSQTMLEAVDTALDQLYDGMQKVDLVRLTRPEDHAVAEAVAGLLSLLATTRVALVRAEAGDDIGGLKDQGVLVLLDALRQAVHTICDQAEAESAQQNPNVLTLTATQYVLERTQGINEKLGAQLERSTDPRWFEDVPRWNGSD